MTHDLSATAQAFVALQKFPRALGPLGHPRSTLGCSRILLGCCVALWYDGKCLDCPEQPLLYASTPQSYHSKMLSLS